MSDSKPSTVRGEAAMAQHGRHSTFPPVTAVLLDVDGTLVDSNDAHAWSWVRAFEEHGRHVGFDAVRRLIGMGGDKLMPRVSPLEEESEEGQRVATTRQEIFARDYLPTLQRFPDADRLVAELRRRGFTVVAASSAKAEELAPLLQIAGAEPGEAVMIGDTPYDIEAAERAGVRSIAFRCGGWRDEDLRGAIAIYDGPSDLLARLDESPLARAGSPGGR